MEIKGFKLDDLITRLSSIRHSKGNIDCCIILSVEDLDREFKVDLLDALEESGEVILYGEVLSDI